MVRQSVETTFDHLPEPVQMKVAAGGQFVDMAERRPSTRACSGSRMRSTAGMLALRGLRVEGYLAAVLALYEPRKIFGARTTERLAPALALFDLAFGRLV